MHLIHVSLSWLSPRGLLSCAAEGLFLCTAACRRLCTRACGHFPATAIRLAGTAWMSWYALTGVSNSSHPCSAPRCLPTSPGSAQCYTGSLMCFVAAFPCCRRMVYRRRLRKRPTPPSFQDQLQRLYCVSGSFGTSKLLLLHVSTKSFLQPFFCSACGRMGGVYSFGVHAYSTLFLRSVSDGRSRVRIARAACSGFLLMVYVKLLR